MDEAGLIAALQVEILSTLLKVLHSPLAWQSLAPTPC